MDRCPNCDAAVRPNAKFCTSCGFRLPTPEPAKPSETWRSPFATTSNYEHNQSWTVPVAPPPAPVAQPEPPQPEPGPVAAAPSEPAPVFAGWPNFSNSAIPAEQPTQAEAPSAEGDHDADAPAPSETREPASASVEEAHAQELDDLARQYDERHGKNGGNQPFAWASPLAETAENEPDSASEPADAPAPAEAEPAAATQAVAEAADEPTEPIPAITSQPSADAAQRAMDLLDELRSLIPSLGSANGVGVDVRAILLDAHAPSNDSDDLEQLRGAIETANNRPRDIDVMLDLVSRAGALQALLDERDRFAAAIERALAATGNGKE